VRAGTRCECEQCRVTARQYSGGNVIACPILRSHRGKMVMNMLDNWVSRMRSGAACGFSPTATRDALARGQHGTLEMYDASHRNPAQCGRGAGRATACDLQTKTVYSAGLVASASQPYLAREFIARLTAPEERPVLLRLDTNLMIKNGGRE